MLLTHIVLSLSILAFSGDKLPPDNLPDHTKTATVALTTPINDLPQIGKVMGFKCRVPKGVYLSSNGASFRLDETEDAFVAVFAVPLDADTRARRAKISKQLEGKKKAPNGIVVCRPWIGSVETDLIQAESANLKYTSRKYKLFSTKHSIMVWTRCVTTDKSSVNRLDEIATDIIRTIKLD
jgi:hypothetical protein